MEWGGWESRLLESSVGTLITTDRLSQCAPQHNLICDWLGLVGWLLQMGSSSSSCHQEDNILLSNYKQEEKRRTGVRYNWGRRGQNDIPVQAMTANTNQEK